MEKLKQHKFWGMFLKNYETKKQGFLQLPFPLFGKCALIFAGALGILITGIIISLNSQAVKPALAGGILCLAFTVIGLWHAYLFTRKKYVRVFAYVARRERSKHRLSKEISTFIIFPDGSERELLLGRKKLNIGGEYAFYFGQTNGTVEPNCNVLYGYEPAIEVERRMEQEKQIMEHYSNATTDAVEEPAEFSVEPETNKTAKVVNLSDYVK